MSVTNKADSVLLRRNKESFPLTSHAALLKSPQTRAEGPRVICGGDLVVSARRERAQKCKREMCM